MRKLHKVIFLLLCITFLPFNGLDGWTAYDRRTPIVEAVDKVLPAVVNISTSKDITVPLFRHGIRSPFDDIFDDLFERTYHVEGLGSGVVVEGGYVITNNHVIEYDYGVADKIYVTLQNDNERHEAIVVGSDPKADVAVLKILGEPVKKYLKWGRSDDLMIGETVIAIGNALGQPFTVTTGIISALNRVIQTGDGRKFHSLIQTNADINQGNSGGPLVNINGEFIGLNTAIMSPTGASVGLGFAIPVSRVKRVYEYWVNGVISLEDQIGLELQDLDAHLTEFFKSYYPALQKQNLSGVVVLEVKKTGLGNKYLQRRDIITAVDQKPVKNVTDFLNRLEEHRGPMLSVNIIRDGTAKTFLIPVPDMKVEKYSWAGMVLQTLDNPWRRWFGLQDDDAGVVVLSVNRESPVNGNIQRGDLILGINEQSIKNLDDLRRAIQADSRSRYININTLRLKEKRKNQPRKWDRRTVRMALEPTL